MKSGSADQSADDAQTDRIVVIAADVFGPTMLGAYLHGSAVLGGMRPTSDVDVLAVIDRHSTAEQRQRLIQALMPISGSPEPRSAFRPVELTVVTQSEVRPWRYPPRMEFQYGEWLKSDYERGFVPKPEPSPDLATLLATVLIGDHSLMGPRPAAVLDPIPEADLRAAIVAGIPHLMADLGSDTRNVLLTLARIWHTLATGEITLKDEAAAWAADRLDGEARTTMLTAKEQYLAGTHGDWASTMPTARATATRLVDLATAAPR